MTFGTRFLREFILLLACLGGSAVALARIEEPLSKVNQDRELRNESIDVKKLKEITWSKPLLIKERMAIKGPNDTIMIVDVRPGDPSVPIDLYRKNQLVRAELELNEELFIEPFDLVIKNLSVDNENAEAAELVFLKPDSLSFEWGKPFDIKVGQTAVGPRGVEILLRGVPPEGQENSVAPKFAVRTGSDKSWIQSGPWTWTNDEAEQELMLEHIVIRKMRYLPSKGARRLALSVRIDSPRDSVEHASFGKPIRLRQEQKAQFPGGLCVSYVGEEVISKRSKPTQRTLLFDVSKEGPQKTSNQRLRLPLPPKLTDYDGHLVHTFRSRWKSYELVITGNASDKRLDLFVEDLTADIGPVVGPDALEQRAQRLLARIPPGRSPQTSDKWLLKETPALFPYIRVYKGNARYPEALILDLWDMTIISSEDIGSSLITRLLKRHRILPTLANAQEACKLFLVMKYAEFPAFNISISGSETNKTFLVDAKYQRSTYGVPDCPVCAPGVFVAAYKLRTRLTRQMIFSAEREKIEKRIRGKPLRP